MTYYNEHDPFAAAWLRELITEGWIADGEVDERSIVDVRPDDVRGFSRCHFFAGIGGWSYALRLAGWDDARPVWTGSCPCQPFSAAGKGDGAHDSRHLWPAWFRLIVECRPDTIFGEQVASIDGLAWLDRVSTDLEGAGYAIGAVDLGAASVGAPHIRQRLWFVAESNAAGWRLIWQQGLSENGDASSGHDVDGCGTLGIVADAESSRYGAIGNGAARRGEPVRRGALGDTDDARSQGRCVSDGQRASELSPWAASDAIWCRDGKSRPVEPGTFPLAHVVSARVGRLRGYGNAIVPHVAAEVIRAYMEQ